MIIITSRHNKKFKINKQMNKKPEERFNAVKFYFRTGTVIADATRKVTIRSH